MNKQTLAPTIVFDLDGTLVDTVADIAAALDRALAPYGCPATHPEDAKALMGEGLSGFFWRGLLAKRLDLPAEEAGDAYRRFITDYRETPAQHSQIYPGLGALLEHVRESGAHTAVCTNKVEDIAIKILEQVGIASFFDAVVGHYGDRPQKPNPLTLIEAISLAGGSRNKALMVGDTGADSSAAIAAGIPAVLVAYGYCPVQVRALSADIHVDTVEELRNELQQFIAAEEHPISFRARQR